MLEIKNLYVEGKGHAQLLRGISFSMELGECIGLTGPSGAGKTMIIKAIMGVLDHTCRIPSGDILLNGVSLPATLWRHSLWTTGFHPRTHDGLNHIR